MHVYPYKSEQYLNEAKNSLERFRNAKNVYEAKESFISFLNASRFALQSLNTDYKKLEGYTEWWKEKSIFLENDILCKYFRKKRNDVIKGGEEPFVVDQHITSLTLDGPVQIGPQGVLKGVIENGRAKWKPVSAPGINITPRMIDAPEEFKELSIFDLSQKYLAIITDVVDDFVKNFGSAK